jgi:16S rRNA (guanine966-N2)-methyltransferase
MLRLALFSILGPEIAEGGFCDLYAGTGSMAVEALSRGAPRATAVENHPVPLACLRRTAETIPLPDLEIVKLDAARFRRPGSYHVVFADPPFAAIPDDLLEKCLELAAPGGWAVLQWPSDRPREWPEGIEVRRYGASSLVIARKG